MPLKRLAVEPGDALARGEHLVEVLELCDPERTGDVGEAVVEAEAIVIEPPHVGRAALVALGVDALASLPPSPSVTMPPSPVVSCLLA